jgi:signal transduction histidine kinase
VVQIRPSIGPGIHRRLALLFCVFVASINGAARGDTTTKHVLIVHGGDLSIRASTLVDPVMRETLEASSNTPVLIYTESLNALTDMSVADEGGVANTLQEKHRNRRFDVVMPVASVALEFVLRWRSTLWPEVPVVFYATAAELVAGRRMPPGVFGVTASTEVGKTLALARHLQPAARDVIVVGGSSSFDRHWQRQASRAFAQSAPGLRVSELLGLPLEELQQRIEHVDPAAIVIFLTMARDDAGQDYRSADVLRRIAQRSSAPMYGVLESYAGLGIVGGSMQDFAANGRQAGVIAAQLLNGERPADGSDVVHTPPRCEVDGRVLQRWKLERARLPDGCSVRFVAATFWQTNPHVPFVASVAGVIVVLLIVAVHFQRRKRAQAESLARHRGEDLTHAARLIAVGEISGGIAHEINQPLGAILTNAAAAEALLKQSEPNITELREIMADIRQDDLRAHRIIEGVRALLTKRELHFETVDMNAVVSSVLNLARPEAEKRGIDLRCTLEPGLSLVAGDPTHLQQVVLNLAINGMDAMDGAQVPVVLEVRTGREGSAAVVVEVIDHGRGIERNALPKLFDSFFTTKEKGLGLGLSIARTIVEAHGGRIWAENTAEGGSIFRFTIPVARSS